MILQNAQRSCRVMTGGCEIQLGYARGIWSITLQELKKANTPKVAEHITPESLGTSRGDRKNSAFLEDEAGRCY